MLAYKILNIKVCDNDTTVREAYLKRLKQYSPEKFPEEYKIIRKAYEKIQTRQKRIEYFLLDYDQDFNFDDYERLFLKIDKSITKEKWDQLCSLYQKNM